MTLLKDRDTRVVFAVVTLFNIPLSRLLSVCAHAFAHLGFEHTSAWMGLGQVTEIIAMFSLGWLLLNWRLKWIFACGLGFGVARFALSACNTETSLLLGIALHGASFVLVFITAQIYLDQQIHPAWRSRAQALLTLMNGGVGNLIGYLGCGWWFGSCAKFAGTDWTIFWGGLSVTVAGVLVYFLINYPESPNPSRRPG